MPDDDGVRRPRSGDTTGPTCPACAASGPRPSIRGSRRAAALRAHVGTSSRHRRVARRPDTIAPSSAGRDVRRRRTDRTGTPREERVAEAPFGVADRRRLTEVGGEPGEHSSKKTIERIDPISL